MVATLTKPVVQDIQITRTVVAERQNGNNADYFQNYLTQWEQRILLYLENNGDPTLIPASVIIQEDKKKFINLYSHPDKNDCQYPILEALRKTTLIYCPACGEDGKPDTLDHYLPKAEFPEYSLLSKNLTPMCWACQRKKSTQILDEHGNRKFLHPYFDQINRSIIKLEIIAPFDRGTSFNLSIYDDIPEPFRSLSERHLSFMGITDRLEDYCIEKYMQLLRLAADEGQAPRDFSSCLVKFLRMEEKKTFNAWGAVFYRSVISNPALMFFLDNGDLPANI